MNFKLKQRGEKFLWSGNRDMITSADELCNDSRVISFNLTIAHVFICHHLSLPQIFRDEKIYLRQCFTLFRMSCAINASQSEFMRRKEYSSNAICDDVNIATIYKLVKWDHPKCDSRHGDKVNSFNLIQRHKIFG